MSSPHPDVPEVGTLVIGGGIVGQCLAIFLTEAGEDVAVIDAGQAGGSTANAGSLHVQMQSRFMRLYPDRVAGLESTLHLYVKAVRFWQELERQLGAGFDLKITGGLMVAEDRTQLDFLFTKAERERWLGLDVDILERADLDRLAPYLGPAVIGAELCHLEGKLNPLLANAVLRRRANELGVRYLGGEAVARLAVDAGRLEALTDRGVIRAKRIALAAGSGSKALAADLGVHIPAEAEPLHMNITEPVAPLIGHLVQHADRPITLKQFGTGQIVIGGGWPARLTTPRQHVEVELASIIGNPTLAQHIVPAIGPARIIRTWAGVNTVVDGRGVLGAVEGVPGLFAAIPGDAGYTLGPLSARLVSDAILGRQPSEDLTPYSARRFAT